MVHSSMSHKDVGGVSWWSIDSGSSAVAGFEQMAMLRIYLVYTAVRTAVSQSDDLTTTGVNRPSRQEYSVRPANR